MNTKVLSFFAAAILSLGIASCANDNVTDTANGTQGNNKTSEKLTTFTANIEAPTTRTSLNYTDGKFFWEAGDKIWVQDDTGVWNQSTNSVTGTNVSRFDFTVPGTYGASSSYKVVYHSSNTIDNQIEIVANQTQEIPNDTKHFGVAGDNGIATATGATGSYSFTLDHKAAYLVFQPYTSNAILQNCYLTKIEVIADNNIAGTYTLDPTTNQLTGSGTTNQIVLTTKGSGAYANGFPLTNSAVSIATNGAYMVIAPGTHSLKVRYWVKDNTTNVEGTITKTYASFNYQANNYYDLTANLKIKDYLGTNYYMWDAQQNYWAGFEWNSNNQQQPTYINQPSNSNYPKSNTDPRWYSTSYPGSGIQNDASTSLFQTLPNANELSWYTMKGDPHWDAYELWTTMGHLYKGGMWMKKLSKIASDNGVTTAEMKTKAANNTTDLRTSYTSFNNNSVSSTILTATEQADYFYLPALGYYYAGTIVNIGRNGYYWSSSAIPTSGTDAYGFYFDSGKVSIYVNNRDFGFPSVAFK